MTAKQEAKQVIDALPENVSLEDVLHALYVRIKFRHGEQEIRAGRGVPHGKAKQRLKKWVR